MVQKNLVAPDGGWGWAIVLSHGLHHFVSIPIMQGFGLLFKDRFAELEFTATDSSIILTTNAAFSMFCGIINAPLLNHFGFRKVSICGAFLTTLGVILTAYSSSFIHYIITYGLITSMGMGMGMSSYPLALNTYFLKKRSKAAGHTMTICGLGPILMPQLFTLLLMLYGVNGAMLIIGGICGHTFISAILLQPVKWHLKEEITDDEDGNEGKEKEEETKTALLDKEKVDVIENNLYDKRRLHSTMSLNRDLEVEAIYGIDTPLAGSVLSLYPNPGPRQRTMSQSSQRKLSTNWWSTDSMNTINLNSSLKIFDENEKNRTMKTVAEVNETGQQNASHDNQPNHNSVVNKVYNPELSVEKEKKKTLLGRILDNIVKTFDLTLLKDPTYVNIMIGMSLAVFAELNFSILTPFIIADYNLATHQIANFISLLSIADILFRFLAPYIGDLVKKPHRVMYLFSLWLLIMSRFSLLLVEGYIPLLVVACGLGIAKGVRTVYWTLVIPSHVPIERLASALGLQYMVNGIFIWIGGPILGYIRDLTGSYRNCIFVINAVTFTTIVLWTIELGYKRCMEKKLEKQEKLKLKEPVK